LPERGEAVEQERAALVRLAAQLGTDAAARPTAETILADELSRRSSLDPGADEARLVGLVDSYALLVSDPRKQADFVHSGMLSQQDPRLRQLLETCLDNLSRRMDLTQAQGAGDGAG
jgi:hypothetical protein